MSKFSATIAGVKSGKFVIRYDRLEITPSAIKLHRKGVVVATMATPRVDFAIGDTLTIDGIKGMIEVEVEQ